MQTIDINKITKRLDLFGYKYSVEGSQLKLFLPMLCYLDIRFAPQRIKISSRIRFAFRGISLEFNFLIYGLVFYALAWFQWPVLNKGVFVLMGLFLLLFVICFVKIEAMKSVVMNWIENDREQVNL